MHAPIPQALLAILLLPILVGQSLAVARQPNGIVLMTDDQGYGDMSCHGKPERVNGYCTDVWFGEARRFVEQNRDRPFFVYLPINAPHGPHNVPAKYTEPYAADTRLSDRTARFFGMIANVDENLGRLWQQLAELELADDTLLVFLADNGGTSGVRAFNADMRGGKGTAYEGGHRAARFLYWPAGGLEGGKDVRPIAAHTDLLPTLDRASCEAAIERQIAKMEKGVEAGPYKADWVSLKAHDEAPEWFRDAKIGIYFHWGVYSVPAYGNEWYPRRMHLRDGKEGQKFYGDGKSYYQHHVETYGEPDEFPYHKFIPMFKAEKFNAEEWADLFVKAGAKYAGPVCEHHDGYSMWDSALTPWNAADTGPKRDITGELEEAIRKRGLKFVTTFHHERTRVWYPRVEGWPTTTSDPRLQLLYMNIGETVFNKIFQAKLGEVIDKYRPDLIWFDGQMQDIKEPYHLHFLAYYFNQAQKWGRDVMVTTKKFQYPQEVSVLDFEKGRANALTPYPWLNDDTISTGSWCYTEDLAVKPAVQVLHDFIDAVSKNGQLLLNISPMADGTIPQNQRDCLLKIGEWLAANGEAIYNTRPWEEYGEGPNVLQKSGSFAGSVEYGPKDLRYTRSKNGKTLYVTALGWPKGELSPTILKVEEAAGGKVELLGHNGELKYTVDGKRIAIDVPAAPPCKYAYVFKLTGFEVGLAPEAAAARDEALKQLQKDLAEAAKPKPKMAKGKGKK